MNPADSKSAKPSPPQNLLCALWGKQRVTIGLTSPEELRRLSDARALTCPGCGALLVLHAGTVRAHHFAHLPGAVCTLPASEPETEEHRMGKLLIAQWLREQLRPAEIIVEAYLPQTQQRADVLAVLPEGKRVALEFQCANLSAREWRRRHRLYQDAGIQDLWLLGSSRLHRETRDEGAEKRITTLRTSELERALLWDGAPLLFFDSVGERMEAGLLARFRPEENAQAMYPTGRLSARPLAELAFPWPLLDWSAQTHPDAPLAPVGASRTGRAYSSSSVSDYWLWEWLAQRFRVTPDTLPAFFGLELPGQEVFACTAQAWQAALYYRWVHRRVGDGWWLLEVETWARAYLPLSRPVHLRRLHGALTTYQEALAAAGMLSLPMGYGRVHARVTADLTTLPAPPDIEETLRLARYRRTLMREAKAQYA